MQIFERNGEYDLVAHYEYFLMNYDWSQRSLPNQIGDWNLLGGRYLSDDDGFVGLSAVYRSLTENHDRVVYLELSEDLLVKMVVGQTVEEIATEVPRDVLEKVLVGQGTSTSDWKS
jgi:hypothetical protein